MSEIILLDGGLDTASSPLAAKRGGLRACQNYEVGAERGYRKMDGIEIYDGSINPEINNWLRITFRSENTDGDLDSDVIGAGVQFPNPYAFLGESIVRAFERTLEGESYLYIMDVELSKTSPVTLIPKEFDVDGVHVQPEPGFDVVYSLGEPRLQSALNTDAQQPLRAPDLSKTQRVGGLFWRNDQLYAIVDVIKISVETDRDTRLGGAYNGAFIYRGTDIEPFGKVLFNSDGVIHYVPTRQLTLNLGDTLTVLTEEMTLVSKDQSEAAVLFVAEHGGTDGWQRQALNRIASYEQTASSNVASFFKEYNRFAFKDTVVDTAADTIIEPDSTELAADGLIYWADKDNVLDDDAAFAEYGWDIAFYPLPSIPYHYYAGLAGDGVSSEFKIKFDFSGIPDDARIVGIEFRMKKEREENVWKQIGGASAPIAEVLGLENIIYDHEVSFESLGVVSENKAYPENWPITFTEFTYGGPLDVWGSNISLEQLKDPAFAVKIKARNGRNEMTFKAFRLQYAEMQVYYIQQSSEVYIWRADVLPGDGIDKKIVVPHRTIDSGLPADKTAKGRIVIEGLDDNIMETVDRGYRVAVGDELRTQAAGGGQLIAVLTSTDGPQYLPSSYQLDAANKRWHAVQAHPYPQENTDVTFLCNGIANAHMWDDRNLLPLATGLDAKYEKPGFSAYWGNSLVLGYDTGTVIFSDIGNPVGFTGGAAGAIEVDVSDKVTGILALKGEALGIFTEKTIQALYGDDTTNLSRKIISPNSGAIAYTVCDMGVPVFTDFRGIGTVDAAQEYGDFQRGRWSYSIQNYITPIIQNESQFLGTPARVLCAYPVRNKNQYRLCFSDASIITMTLMGQGLEQQFTTQSIFTRVDGEKVLMPYLAVEHGVSSAGRDVIFCSLDSGFHNGYVFRVDQGNRFPSAQEGVGTAIEAWIDLNFNHLLDRPSGTTRIDRLAVYGLCKGYANLGFNQSVFYGEPGEYTVSFVAGDEEALATKPQKHFMSIVNSGCEARDVSFRLSSDEIEASHTLQAIEMFQTIEGQRRDDKR